MKRKSLGKKTRFEVFKRDSFTCQYCGNSSPEIILEIDHIKPVSKGGDNELTNLITSCFDCNRGKRNIELNDNSVVVKQFKQLEELNERRTQIEMMMEWREELSNLNEDIFLNICVEIEKKIDGTIAAPGEISIKKWLKKYSVKTLLEALDKSAEQYETDSKIFEMIPKIAYFIDNPQPDYLTELFYIRGIMRNRYSYVNDRVALQLLELGYKSGLSTQELKEIVLNNRNWTLFKQGISDAISREE